MDFLEDLFDFSDRKRRKRSGYSQDDDHHDHEHDDDDHRRPYPTQAYPQASVEPAAFRPGAVCRKCSRQTVQGAKFCHACGAAIELPVACASCGSTLPANGLFCPQCGYKNG
jgi:hypothetical protein